ncbi:MAG: peptidoglycan DD-metalloendopeptidase family protein [Faecalibacterium prausnitzii]|nr:peptidoglycan DD-metalloendopeptidase family protein [Faecalibacterium prausnitzii]
MKKASHAKPFRLKMGGYTPRHARPESTRSKLVRAVSLGLACLCLLFTATVYPASAATRSSNSMSSLQNRLDKLSQSINQHKKELSDAKKKEQAAKALEGELKEKVGVIQDQITVLSSQIATVQNSIGETEQKITAKEAEITQKEAEIQDQWSDFKQHMAAMQELRDGGSIAMLSAVNDLYELLTFNEVMQDISIKDTEIMDNMKNAKAALEADKSQLESQRAELKSKKADLDAQNSQMKAKQSELNSSISAAQLSAAEAQAAQKTAQAAIESDEMNYQAVKKEIQKLIAAAAASKPQLSFTGFICPLKSYSRVSSEYGWRKNPVSGVNKLHAGTDFAAPGGTPIYAAASGYVQVAGWSSGGYGNYVIIYHGKMSDGNSYTTLYGHMRSVATSAGKYVQQGQLIGYVGSTGNSTGNHLHLEVWKGGNKANAVNPRNYIPIPHN